MLRLYDQTDSLKYLRFTTSGCKDIGIGVCARSRSVKEIKGIMNYAYTVPL